MSRMSYHLSQQAKIVTALANCTGKQRKGKSWHSHSPCLALRRIWISPLWKEQGGFIQVIRKRELRDVQPISSLTRRIWRIIWSVKVERPIKYLLMERKTVFGVSYLSSLFLWHSTSLICPKSSPELHQQKNIFKAAASWTTQQLQFCFLPNISSILLLSTNCYLQ